MYSGRFGSAIEIGVTSDPVPAVVGTCTSGSRLPFAVPTPYISASGCAQSGCAKQRTLAVASSRGRLRAAADAIAAAPSFIMERAEALYQSWGCTGNPDEEASPLDDFTALGVRNLFAGEAQVLLARAEERGVDLPEAVGEGCVLQVPELFPEELPQPQL